MPRETQGQMDFFARAHYEVLLREPDQHQALARLRAACEPQLVSAFDRFERAALASDATVDSRLSRLAGMNRWLANIVATSDPRRAHEVYLQLEDARGFLRAALGASRAAMGPQILYGLALGLIGWCVTVVYLVFVLPQFAATFSTLGSELPGLTRMLMLVGPWLAVLLPLIALTAWWFTRRDYRDRRAHLEDCVMPERGDAALSTKLVRDQYRRMLWMLYAQLLQTAGRSPEVALDDAARLLDMPTRTSFADLANGGVERSDDPQVASLRTAARLGILAEEIDRQWRSHANRLVHNVVAANSTLWLAIRIALYAFAGTLVIAMYLPILKLGAAI